MEVDLLKTKVTGTWFVEIEINGRTYWRKTNKAITASLWAYIHDAYIGITGKQPPIDEDPNWDWEVIEYSPEKRIIWVGRKWA